MWLARAKEKVGEPIDEEMAVLHSELLYAGTRVRVKLASTIPPPGRGGGEEGRRYTQLDSTMFSPSPPSLPPSLATDRKSLG